MANLRFVNLLLPASAHDSAVKRGNLFFTIRSGATINWPNGVIWSGLLLEFSLNLLIPAYGGAFEEPGWRGYALPNLQKQYSPLVGTLLLGVIGVLWHLPLFVMGDIPWPDIFLIFAAYIIFTWIYNGTNGSILLVMLTHAINNTISGSFFSPMFSGADAVKESWMLALVWGIAAIVILVATKGKLLFINSEVGFPSPKVFGY